MDNRHNINYKTVTHLEENLEKSFLGNKNNNYSCMN